MSGQPTLRGPRLTLRPARAGDLAPLAALLRLPQVRRFLCDDRVLPDERVARILADSAAQAAQGLGMWVAMADADPFAGTIHLLPVDPAVADCTPVAGHVEPAVAFAPERQGLGLAAEALALCVAHARDRLGLPALAGVADEPNAPSRRMLRRAGFVETGRARGAAHPLVLHRLALRP